MSRIFSRNPSFTKIRNSVSIIALGALLPAAPLFAQATGAPEAEVQLAAIAPVAASAALPADVAETNPEQEELVSYHGVQGYQLDTANASESGARRIFVSRQRKEGKSITIIDHGNGVQVSGLNEKLAVTPRTRTGGERNVYGYDYRRKALAGPDSVVSEFNRILAPRLRAAAGKKRNAVWTTQFSLSELVGSRVSDAMFDMKLDRRFITHNGKQYVLIGYEVPAFTYKDAAGNNVIHWASGFIITNPDYSIVYYYGAKNMGTENAATPDAAPISARLFSFATDETGKRLLDISDFEAARKLIDRATDGATDYKGVLRDTKAGRLVDNGFFNVARMIDIAATAVGENSGNEGAEVADSGWDQVGSTATRATQGNNVLSVFRALTNAAGTYAAREQMDKLAQIYNKLYDGERAAGWGELWTDTTKSGGSYIESLLEYASENKLAYQEIVDWFGDAQNGAVKTEGIGAHLTKLFGNTPKEVANALARLGAHGAEGIAKIAGPIAWAASGYTIAQGFVSQDPNALSPTLIGDASADGHVIGGFVVDKSQFFDRVFLDVGLGLALDLVTLDLIGFGLDGGAIVVKSFADTAEAWTYYRNTQDDIALTESTFFEIVGSNYKRTKPFVDTNLPRLIAADRQRSGQDWGKVTRSTPNLPFAWDEVHATGSISDIAAEKINENNFRAALLKFLTGRNRDVAEIRPGGQTIIDPPLGNGGSEDGGGDDTADPTTTDTEASRIDTTPRSGEDTVDDTIQTGTVTASTAARRPSSLGTASTPKPKNPLPLGVYHEPREGWHNEPAYDKNGKSIGYRPVYPLAKPLPERTEGDAYEGLFGDVAKAAEKAADEQAALELALKDPYSPESIAKRKTDAQAKLDAQYEAVRKAKGLPPLDNFKTAAERQAYYQGQQDKQQADRTKNLPKLDTFKTAEERKAYYEGILGVQQAERTEDLPALDSFKTPAEREAYYKGQIAKQHEERTGELPALDNFKTPEERRAYYDGLLADQQRERSEGLPGLDNFKTAEERQAYNQAKQDAQQADSSGKFPPLDNYATPEERKAAAQAWLDARFEDKTDFSELFDAVNSIIDLAFADEANSDEEAKTKTPQGFTPTPIGEKYPNQLDYGDGSYPNQLEIDWSKTNPWGKDGKYPNQVDYGDGSYPNKVQLDYAKWDPNANYPFQIPPGYFQTPYDPDSFNKFIENNAFKYGNMSGMIPTNLPGYDEFIKYYGLDELNRMARNAGYPNIFAALQDKDYLIGLSKNPGFRKKALSFECNVRFGVAYDCIALNRQERGQLDLGDILRESRSFLSEGFTDITIDSLLLTILLRDFGLEDNDIVNLMVTQFGQSLFNSNITLTNAGIRKMIRVRKGVVEVKVTAVNTGDIPPNTAEVSVENVSEGDAKQDFSQDEGGSSSLRVKVE